MSKRPSKILVSFSIFPEEKERALVQAENKGMSLSSYIRKALIDRVAEDEKSQN